MLFRHRRCGHLFTPAITCDTCGEPIASADLEALRGPGARPGPGTEVMGTVLPADPDLD